MKISKASSNLGASLVRDFQEGWESCGTSAWGAASAGKLGKVLVACVLGRGTWKGLSTGEGQAGGAGDLPSAWSRSSEGD